MAQHVNKHARDVERKIVGIAATQTVSDQLVLDYAKRFFARDVGEGARAPR